MAWISSSSKASILSEKAASEGDRLEVKAIAVGYGGEGGCRGSAFATKKTMVLEVGDGMEELANLGTASLEEGGNLRKEGEAGRG